MTFLIPVKFIITVECVGITGSLNDVVTDVRKWAECYVAVREDVFADSSAEAFANMHYELLLNEFMAGKNIVRFSGLRYYHTSADTLELAVKAIQSSIESDVSFQSYTADNVSVEVLAPVLALEDSELSSWPYWRYLCDDDIGVCTSEGRDSIPEYWYIRYPVPEDFVTGKLDYSKFYNALEWNHIE